MDSQKNYHFTWCHIQHFGESIAQVLLSCLRVLCTSNYFPSIVVFYNWGLSEDFISLYIRFMHNNLKSVVMVISVKTLTLQIMSLSHFRVAKFQ
jgi:hypothetical protein